MRWEASIIVLLVLALAASPALAHKSPIIEYGTSATWRTGYSFIPRQPVVGEPITLTEEVDHLQGEIKGNVTVVFSVYKDESVNDWYAGKQYKNSDWLLIHHAPGQPMDVHNKFDTQFIVDQPGNYFVTVDLYEDGQYIGQDMRAVDVEQRTIGPMFIAFSAAIIGVVLIGVKKRVL